MIFTLKWAWLTCQCQHSSLEERSLDRKGYHGNNHYHLTELHIYKYLATNSFTDHALIDSCEGVQ